MQNHIVAAATKILLIATAVFGLAAGPSQAGEGARMPPPGSTRRRRHSRT